MLVISHFYKSCMIKFDTLKRNFHVLFTQEMAIISDISDGRIYFINKTDGERMYSTIRIGSETTYGIAVYTEDNQPKKNQGKIFSYLINDCCFA